MRGFHDQDLRLEIANEKEKLAVASAERARKAQRLSLTQFQLQRFRELLKQHLRGIYFNTLGTAEFRMNNLVEAVAAAQKSVELTPKELNLPSAHPGDIAILAMSHFKLKNNDKVTKYRQQFDEAMKLEAFKDDEECLSFQKEVIELFESQIGEGSNDDK